MTIASHHFLQCVKVSHHHPLTTRSAHLASTGVKNSSGEPSNTLTESLSAGFSRLWKAVCVSVCLSGSRAAKPHSGVSSSDGARAHNSSNHASCTQTQLCWGCSPLTCCNQSPVNFTGQTGTRNRHRPPRWGHAGPDDTVGTQGERWSQALEVWKCSLFPLKEKCGNLCCLYLSLTHISSRLSSSPPNLSPLSPLVPLLPLPSISLPPSSHPRSAHRAEPGWRIRALKTLQPPPPITHLHK